MAVADRFYGNYWMIVLLVQAGVDVCFRKHQARHTDFRRGRRLGKDDHIISWHRPGRPPWMSKEMYDSMPKSIELREIRYVMAGLIRATHQMVDWGLLSDMVLLFGLFTVETSDAKTEAKRAV